MTHTAQAPLLELARAGDGDAFAELIVGHLPALYDFIARILADTGEAAAIAADACGDAARTLASLPANAAFEPWLLGIGYRVALPYVRRPAPVLAPVGGLFSRGSGEEGASAADLSLAWQAVAGLDPRQRSVLELHVRRGLDGSGVAAALRISVTSAEVLVRRVGAAAETAIVASVLASPDRRCRGLTAALRRGTAGGASSAATAHIEGCTVCRSRRERLGPALDLYRSVADIEPPPGAIDGIPAQASLLLVAPLAAGDRAAPADPPPPSADAPGRLRRQLGAIVGGAVLAAVVLGGAAALPGSPLGLRSGKSHGGALPAFVAPTEATSPTPTPRRTPAPPAVRSVTPAPSSTAAATATAGGAVPGASPTDTPSPGPTSTPTPPATATASPTAVPTATPCPPQLTTNVPEVNVGTETLGKFTALNVACGTLPFTAAVTTGGEWLELPVTQFEITGATANEVTVRLNVNRAALAEGNNSGRVRLTWSGTPIEVLVRAFLNGSPPVIVSATGQCDGGGQVTFVAEVTDDFFVSSVAVTYGTGSGTGSQQLVSPDSTNWSATFAFPADATDFEIVARDGAGHTTTMAVPPAGC